MVWAAMSANAVSELHILPQKCTVSTKYYVDNILDGPYKAAFACRRSTGTILQRKICEKMSNSIFQQDGAPTHTSKLSQEWCRLNLPSYWVKEIWPGNSLDLSLIENLWAVVKQDLSECRLRQIRICWKRISKECGDISSGLLRRMIDGMPDRMKKCLDMKGGNIGK